MGIVAKPPSIYSSSSSRKETRQQFSIQLDLTRTNKPGSMSGQHQQEFHHPENLFGYNNGFDRSSEPGLQAHHHDQIRPKMRSGFEPAPPTSTLVGIDHANPTAVVDPSTTGLHPVYETAGMLSEMFNSFGPGNGPGGPGEMLDYRRAVGGLGPEWYEGRQVVRDNHDNHHQIPSMNAENVAAMQLFLTNPPPRSPSPPQQQQPPGNSNSTLHMLLPSPTSIPPGGAGGGFHPINTIHQHHHQHSSANTNPNLWSPHINHPSELGGIVEGQGLSLSLSSSLQHFEGGKQPEDDTHIMFFNLHHHQQQQHSMMQSTLQTLTAPFEPGPGPSSTVQHQVPQFGFGSAASSSSSLGVVNVLRTSKYAKPAQELLEEFCSVGRGHLKKPKLSRQSSVNPTLTTSGGGGGGGAGSSSSTKDPPPLSAADRIEHQRRKVKLLSMLDEVDRRYNNYCEQMQMVVNSFDLVMGYGAATPYTALAQKAMSRHFRCLKDAIQGQLKQSCELLGEKDPTATSGLTKGDTPRLKVLEQSLRQQRAFHQMGLMEQEAWRPQRGLPERSVNILRAWLFEHFLHPYPNDADKHMLARQTGLSRNQVSNWFINARVRLWKPMVEEMYQQESKELEEEGETDFNQTSSSTSNTNNPNPNPNPNPTQNPKTNTFVAETMTSPDSDPSSSLPTTINRGHHHHHQQQPLPPPHGSSGAAATLDNVNVGPTTMIRFGAASGDVSLTLGLRHAGNAPDKSAAFSVRDFGSC